jgi:hypothetical protein
MALTDHAREVRSLLVDAGRLCAALGIDKGATRQAGGLVICCPAHGERNPSCSVTNGPDGTLRAKCFACDWSADALGIIALVRGLDTRSADQFREIMAEGASIGGDHRLAAEILDGRPMPDRPKVPPPTPREARDYPPREQVVDVWSSGTTPADDVWASSYLVRRVIDPVLVGARGLARVVSGPLPRWAAYRGRPWTETGHRLVVRAFDSDGLARSLRAIQILPDQDGPKRLPPAGHKAAGLALLNEGAWRMLHGDSPGRLGIVEGEPDWAWWGTRTEEPLIGLVSGSWTDAFAAAVPRGCRVIIRTHNDEAGDRYAEQVAESLKHKCELVRRALEAA